MKFVYFLIGTFFIISCSTINNISNTESEAGFPNHKYVNEDTFGKEIDNNGNFFLYRTNKLMGCAVPTYMVIYKKVNNEGYYLDRYNSTCDIYGKIEPGYAYRGNFEPGEYCIVVTSQTEPYDYFSGVYGRNSSAIILYVGDEYKGKESDCISKANFKFDDKDVTIKYVFLYSDENLITTINLINTKPFVGGFNLDTKKIKKENSELR